MEQLNYTPVSDLIKKAILEYIDKYDNGLVITPLPTAIGKTYSSCQAIADYIQQTVDMVKAAADSKAKKIIWVTTLIKVLPDKDLRDAFAKRGMDFDSMVLRVKSNKDCIKDYFNNVGAECPVKDTEYFKFSELWRKMEQQLKEIDDYTSKTTIEAKEHLEKISMEFNETERNFRKVIRKYLFSTVRNINNKYSNQNKTTVKKLIYNDPQFKWISDIYPQAREENYKVLLMTTKKLFLSRTMFVKGDPYLSEDWLNNAVIFVDEIDATKNEINNHIQEETAQVIKRNSIADFKKLFNSIMDGLKDEEPFGGNTYGIINNDKRGPERINLIKEAEALKQKYLTKKTFKTVWSNEERRDFMYYCGTWVNTNKETDKSYTCGLLNKNNVVEISYQNKDTLINNDKMISILDMINDINAYIKKFIWWLQRCAEDYRLAYMKDPQNAGTELSIDDALHSLLHKFNGIEDNKRKALLLFFMTRQKKHVKNFYEKPYSYYRNGATYCWLENNSSHSADTIMNMGRIPETAEEVMSFIAKNALVFGLSATANCYNILGNYNMDYVRNEIKTEDEVGEWTDNFHDMIKDYPELAVAIKKELEFRYKKYHSENLNDKISIDIQEPLTNTYDQNDDTLEITQRAFPNEKCWAKMAKSINNIILNAINDLPSKNKNDGINMYFFSRYLNIAKIIFNFAGNRSHQSCLCVSMKMPGGENTSLSEKTIIDLIDLINKYYKKNVGNWCNSDLYGKHDENIMLFSLRSADFDKQKIIYEKLLKEGKRLFVLSTYATVGAGINLQHPICEWVKPFLVKLDAHEKRDMSKKDIDELAILDLTHIVENLTYRDEFDWPNQIANIGQLEEAYETGLINATQKNQQIKMGFHAVNGNGIVPTINVLSDSEHVDLHATHWVVQVDGRTKRTLWRNKKQTIYIDENVLRKLHENYLQNMYGFLSEELKALLEIKHSHYKPIEYDEQRKFEFLVEMKTGRARQTIVKLLKAIDLKNKTVNWSEKDIKAFETMKWKALRHPLPTKRMTIDRFYSDFYFRSPDGKPKNSYYYYQQEEYSKVYVGFEDKLMFVEHMKQKMGDDFSRLNIHEMSLERTKLPILMKYEGMEDHFKKMGIDTKWKPSLYLPTPIIFQERILGGIGEVAGSYILATALKSYPIIAKPMPWQIHELFDSEIDGFPNVYIDFKYYTYFFEQNDKIRTEHNIRNRFKISTKMEMAKAKAVFIVGLIAPNDEKILPSTDEENENIYYIPGLIDSEGQVVNRNLNYFIEHLELHK